MVPTSKTLYIKEYYFTWQERILQVLFLLVETIIEIRKNQIFKK